MRNSNTKFAFTLAEVLITLGIIGVVAALTIPTLINKYQESAMINRLKQNYSIFSQALKMAEIEHGVISEWVAPDADDLVKSQTYMANLKPYLKIIRDCTDKGAECYGDISIIYKTKTDTTGNFASKNKWAKGTLSNGTDFYMSPMIVDELLPNLTTYSALSLDLDGAAKGKNQYGYDMFDFFITDKGIFPRGLPNSTEGMNFQTSCIEGWYACTAWVLAHQNMDYLHCDDLSWNGKTKCK